jgi:hypothetical protein
VAAALAERDAEPRRAVRLVIRKDKPSSRLREGDVLWVDCAVRHVPAAAALKNACSFHPPLIYDAWVVGSSWGDRAGARGPLLGGAPCRVPSPPTSGCGRGAWIS